ncbi:MAG: hypothetical protein BIFFINMI_01390 [Phycisphaerae bacterium]|nr:hypothetical protein [Phycisphaerae bacterium]
MAIQFGCTGCGRVLSAQEQHAGQRIACPHCGTEQLVPPPVRLHGPSAAPPAMPTQIGAMPVPPQTAFSQPTAQVKGGRGLAVAALVLAVIPFTSPIGFMLGIVALISASRKPDRPGNGMALASVLVGCGWLTVGLMVLMVARGVRTTHDIVWRVKCAANLNNLGKTMRTYSSSNMGYPSVPAGRRIDMSPTGVEDSLDTDASLWLLVRSDAIGAGCFVCLSDDGAEAFSGQAGSVPPDDAFPRVDDSGHSGGRHRSLSYSYQVPQGPKGVPRDGMESATSFAILADRAPPMNRLELLPEAQAGSAGSAADYVKSLSKKQKAGYNSPNHGGEGQNVLFLDGHVEWSADPFCGVHGDNIYTRGGGRDWSTDPQERLRGRLPANLNAITTADGPVADGDSFLANILYGKAVTGP